LHSLAAEAWLTVQVELEIMLPEDMSVKESHDIALMLQHKVIIIFTSFTTAVDIPAACLHSVVKAAMLYKLFSQSPDPLCSNLVHTYNELMIVASKENRMSVIPVVKVKIWFRAA
jgi:hypothetical protein